MEKLFGGKIKLAIIFCFFSLLACCDEFQKDYSRDIVKMNNGFVEDRFIKKAPIAQLINMGDYFNGSDSFYLEQSSRIKIYAVGEILLNISDHAKKYLLQGDDIEIFIKPANRIDTANKAITCKFRFSYAGDTANYQKRGIIFNWRNDKNKKYISQISIPWTVLGVNFPKTNELLKFDIAIGDNDDGFIQEKKISWCAKSEEDLEDNTKVGELLLAKTLPKSKLSKKIFSLYADRMSKEKGIACNIPKIGIKNSILSSIKDKYDLSANVKSSWDEKNIYFHIEVNDSRQKRIMLSRIKDRDIFVDKGWIEDESGNAVWAMDAKKSHWAGGTFKNQKIDTVLYLPPGKYKVKYITDENHSFGNWILPPPSTPLYGILVYTY